MKTKTGIKAGSFVLTRNHNQIKIKTSIKAGSFVLTRNHNQYVTSSK